MRSRYYAFLTVSAAWILALVLFVGPITAVIGIFHPILFVVSCIGSLIIAGRFACSRCSHPLVRPKMTVGTIEVAGYSMFPGASCTNCGKSTDDV